MRPSNLRTRVFLDGGNPDESTEIVKVLGFLDGQTTNPTLIAKNPKAKERLSAGKRFTEKEVLEFYRNVVQTISSLIPRGSVSVEVYADAGTSAERMLDQASEMSTWIPNVHIKFPTSTQGLKAAGEAVKRGLRVNMTLCFSQAQAAAVYAATAGAKRGDVFVSPFVGRLDDRGENGMDLIAHILTMYKGGDGHVEVLTASVRTLDHFLYALMLGTDIVTAPFGILKDWAGQGLPVPGDGYRYDAKNLKPVIYEDTPLTRAWHEYDISHPLTDKGMELFSKDWNALIG